MPKKFAAFSLMVIQYTITVPRAFFYCWPLLGVWVIKASAWDLSPLDLFVGKKIRQSPFFCKNVHSFSLTQRDGLAILISQLSAWSDIPKLKKGGESIGKLHEKKHWKSFFAMDILWSCTTMQCLIFPWKRNNILHFEVFIES